MKQKATRKNQTPSKKLKITDSNLYLKSYKNIRYITKGY